MEIPCTWKEKGYVCEPVPENTDMAAEIRRMAKEKNAVILAHYYTDGALQEAERRYQAMRQQVEALKATGEATAAQLTQLTRMRMLRDSLQTVFDVECAKIRYIKKKMQ